MAEILIDLSGKAGLSSRAFGDTDMVTPQPNLVMTEKEGEMAGGKFNPYLRDGYLAPITSTSSSVTSPDTLSAPLTAVAYDPINEDVYWSGANNKLYKQTSLTDLSLEVDTTLDSDSVINDISFYEVDSKPVMLYTYDYPANTTDKEKAIFLGYKSLVATSVPIVYSYNPIDLGTADASYTITSTGADKLAALVNTATFSNSGHTTIQVSDLFLRLRRSTSGQAQVWTMKASVYSTTLSSTADGNAHYIPDSLLGSATVSAASLEDDFSSTQFSLSSAITVSGHIAIILEPDTPGDVTGGEGVEWLAGTVAASTSNGLYYDSAWYQLNVDNTYNFSVEIGLQDEANILSKEEFAISTNLYGVETDTPESFSIGSGNISQAVTIGTKESNIVVVAIAIRTSSDQIAGVTIGGQAMTLLSNTQPTAVTYADRLYIYYKEGVAAGSQTIATTGLTAESKMVVFKHYGIKTGTVALTGSYEGTSGAASIAFGVSNSTYIPARGVGMYFGIIDWKEIGGPDYYQPGLYGMFSNTSMDNTLNPGTNARPLYAGVWYSRTDSIYPYGRSLGIRSYDNGSFDTAFDSAFGGYIVTVSPLDSTLGESSYWTLTGQNSGKAFIRNASNGFSYLFADRAIHKFDGGITGGGSGFLTKDVIRFPDYQTIMDATDYRSRFYVLVNQYQVDRTGAPTLNTFSGKCGVYVWGRLSTQLGSDDFIELPGVREGRSIYASPDGQLRIITISDNGIVELRQFGYNDSGGVVFPVIKKLGIGAFPQVPSGVKTAGDKTLWVGNDGNLYCEKDGKVTILFQAKAGATSSTGTITNITTGALLYGSGNETGDTGYRSNKQAITFSYKDGSATYITKVYPLDVKTGPNSAQTPNQGDVYSGVTYIPMTSVTRQVRVYNAPISGSGTDVIATVKIYFNQSTSVGMTKTVTKNEAKRGYVDFHINKPYVHAVQIEIEWNTSEPIGADMYLPSVAIISHDKTDGKSPDNG